MPSVSASRTSSGIGRDVGVGLVLEGEQADLRSVAVGEHDLVVPCDLGDGLGGHLDVGPLDGGVHGLAPTQQGVAAEGDDDEHHGRSLLGGSAPAS